MHVSPESLTRTVDSVDESFFFSIRPTKAEREEVASWIAARQGLPGCYAEMFAPTDTELKSGVQLFTGEKIGPSASLRHVVGEEACRALILLNASAKPAKVALVKATASMLARLDHFQPKS